MWPGLGPQRVRAAAEQRTKVGGWWSWVVGQPLATLLVRSEMEITQIIRVTFLLLTSGENGSSHPLESVCTGEVADRAIMNSTYILLIKHSNFHLNYGETPCN